MGVIQRQSIKQSIVSYVGVLIGAISALFIYPLAMEENGLIRFLIAAATLSLPIISLGVNAIAVRFFPDFQDSSNKHNGFLFVVTSIIFIGFFAYIVLVSLFKGQIYQFYEHKPELYLQYLPYVIPLALLMALANLFKIYATNFQRVVVPFIFNDLLLKIAFPLLILLYYFNIIGHRGIANGLLVTFFTIFLLLIGYLSHLNVFSLKPQFSFLHKKRIKDISAYGSYTILGSLGGVLATQIDIFMVANLTTLYATSVYSISLFITNTIEAPLKAIFSMTSPIISKAWKEKDLPKINDLYKRSSITLFLFGVFLFLLIWLNIDDLFTLLPKGEELTDGKYVILFLGLAKLFDQLTSINGAIISYSKYYRFNLVVILVSSIVNIFLNIWLIPIYNITGAAIATLFSISILNLMKLIFIYFKVNMQPFSLQTLWSVLLAVGSYFIISWIPSSGLLFLDIVIRSTGLAALYGSAVLYFNLSPDITNLVQSYWNKFKGNNRDDSIIDS